MDGYILDILKESKSDQIEFTSNGNWKESGKVEIENKPEKKKSKPPVIEGIYFLLFLLWN